jgi:hypothetical protein
LGRTRPEEPEAIAGKCRAKVNVLNLHQQPLCSAELLTVSLQFGYSLCLVQRLALVIRVPAISQTIISPRRIIAVSGQ